jgi:hypothetical protein
MSTCRVSRANFLRALVSIVKKIRRGKVKENFFALANSLLCQIR